MAVEFLRGLHLNAQEMGSNFPGTCNPTTEVAFFDSQAGQYKCCGHQNLACAGCSDFSLVAAQRILHSSYQHRLVPSGSLGEVV